MISNGSGKKLSLILVSMLLWLSSCSMMDLRQEISEAKETLRVVKGEVIYERAFCDDCSILLVAMGADATLHGYKILPNPQAFESILQSDSKHLFAFIDRNSDRALQPEEASAFVELEIDTEAAEFRPVKLVLDDSNKNIPPGVSDLVFMRGSVTDDYPIRFGDLADIEQKNFNVEVSKMGMWEPLRFLKEGHAGIYLINKYDPKKTPVLLVHGIDGNPSQFKSVVESLDNNKYQFLVYYYPSGFRLHTLANGLYGILAELDAQYGFHNLHIVAHSMGGLVSRDFMSICSRRGGCDYLGHYVSIATPYEGHKSAQSGVDYSPVVMPVWNDMAPKSDFIRTLFDVKRPVDVDHHLFFGFDNDGSGASSDGVIDMSSQLRLEAQREATSISGFNDTHVGLLKNDYLLNELKRFLDERS